MADIDVERKGAGAWWWWLLGLLILALVIWAVAQALGGDDDAATVAAVEEPVADVGAVAPMPMGDAGAGAGAGEVPAPVQQYLSTCAGEAQGQMGLDHQYTSNCIIMLVASIDAMMQSPNLQGVDAQAQMQDARQKAERLQQSANASSDHAGMTQEAFASTATLLDAIQSQRYPNLGSQVDQLQEAAGGISASQPLLDQRDAVQRYFRTAGDVLNGMATAPAGG